MPGSPIPILSYDVDPTFGWKEVLNSDALLVLPPIPRSEILAEEGAALFVSTGFMLLCGGGVVAAAQTTAGSPDDVRYAMLGLALLPAFAAIAVWVLVLLRFVHLAWSRGRTAMVSVTPVGLHVVGGLLPGPSERWWSLAEIAGLRLDPVRGIGGRRLRQVRLQVATVDQKVTAIRLPWPGSELTESHERRLRQAIGLAARQ